MCMKEYGCCPKFKRGDNSTYTFTKKGGQYFIERYYYFRMKLELWVTSLSDTPRLQYYDVQTLEYWHISKLIISPRPSVSFSHLNLLLWNHWTEISQTCQKCSLDGPLPELCFWCWFEIQHGCQEKIRLRQNYGRYHIELMFVV
jgi:hypothetical protein